ncbi:hypothetical protein JXA56_02490 [Candidatus Micrarchaeota archaeon]|nr:hypothetical protein [Candidatus Micrarchaeota archaeon]
MYRFRESAVSWLEGQNFSGREIEKLEMIMNGIGPKLKQQTIKVPKDTEAKVSAMIYLLGSITDSKGNLDCFDGNFIDIPEEAKTCYGNDREMQELENQISENGIKFGRLHSSPRRRGSVRKEY